MIRVLSAVDIPDDVRPVIEEAQARLKLLHVNVMTSCRRDRNGAKG